MKFSVNETLIGKRLQTLDGTTAKITGVTNTGYNIEGQRKAVRVWQVTRVGGKLVQVEGSKADAKDTGKGYVTYEEDKKAKTDKKDKKVSSSKKEDSSPKSSNSKKDKKAKEADLDEEDDEAERVTLTSMDKNSAELIRTAVRDAVRGVLDCMFTNSCEITTSVMITPEDKDKIAVNMGITFELPEVEEEDYVAEFEMSPATAKLYSAGKWEKMVEGNSKSIAQICEALQEDDAESIVHGARLVHEDGSVIFFVGVSKDKRLLAQDEDGDPLTVSMKDLMAYEVQAAPEDDEELDLGDDDEELDLGDADDEELDLGDYEDEDEDDEDSGEKSREVSAFESKVEEIFKRNPATALKFVAKQDRKLVLTSIDTTFDINEELAEELAEFDNNELAAWYIENVYETEEEESEEEEEEDDLDEEEDEEEEDDSDSEFDFEISDEDELDDEEEDDDLDDEEEEELDDEEEDDTSTMIESVRTEKSVKNLVKMCHTYDIKFKKSLLADPKAAVKILRAKIIAYLEA